MIYSPTSTGYYKPNVNSNIYMKMIDCATAVTPYYHYKPTHVSSCASWVQEYDLQPATAGYQLWNSDGSSYIITNKYTKIGNYTCGDWAEIAAVPVPLSDRFRQIIQSRQCPLFISSRTPVRAASEERELRARQTLRRVLGDDGFKRFLRNGFVSVRSNSGKVYQIYPGHGMTIVYNHGTPIEKLCVVLRGDFTPTDSLLTRYIMILHDENHFRSYANVFAAPIKTSRQSIIDTRPLPQILQALKTAA